MTIEEVFKKDNQTDVITELKSKRGIPLPDAKGAIKDLTHFNTKYSTRSIVQTKKSKSTKTILQKTTTQQQW